MLFSRKVSCDICNIKEEEKDFGLGWSGWAIINGIGATEPENEKSLTKENMELYLCPLCKIKVSEFLTVLKLREEP